MSVEDILETYVQVSLPGSSTENFDFLEDENNFVWEDDRMRLDKVFKYMHNVLSTNLWTNVIQPAVTNVTARVLDKMHVTCIRDMLHTHTLVLCKDAGNTKERNCSFCGQYVSTPQYVKFVANPYLMWTYKTKADSETFSMHKNSAALLFSVWKIIHFDYFLNVNLALTGQMPVKPFVQEVLSALDDCISTWPSCMHHVCAL